MITMQRTVVIAIALLVTLQTVTAFDLVVKSQTNRFTHGDYVTRKSYEKLVVRENPRRVRQQLKTFNHNLRVDFWRDPQFHPFIFQQRNNFQPCGRYPVRECIQLNKYGGFIRAPDGVSDAFIGYGAYNRFSIENGKLYPQGQLRERILRQNLNKLKTLRSQ